MSLTTNGFLLSETRDLVSALDAVSVSYHGDPGVLREGLALLERMGVQRMVNFVMLDRDKPRFGEVLEACKTFGGRARLARSKAHCGLRQGLVPCAGARGSGRPGRFGRAGRAAPRGAGSSPWRAKERFLQCSFVRKPWAIGELAKAFGCLEEVKDEVGIPIKSAV